MCPRGPPRIWRRGRLSGRISRRHYHPGLFSKVGYTISILLRWVRPRNYLGTSPRVFSAPENPLKGLRLGGGSHQKPFRGWGFPNSVDWHPMAHLFAGEWTPPPLGFFFRKAQLPKYYPSIQVHFHTADLASPGLLRRLTAIPRSAKTGRPFREI